MVKLFPAQRKKDFLGQARRRGYMRRPEAAAALLLFLVISVVDYWPVLNGKVPFPADIVLRSPAFEAVRDPDFQVPPHGEMGDLATLIYPWRNFVAQSIKRGELPLWNPYVLSGAPFLADSQSAIFYPPNALYYVLPTPVAWSMSIILKIALAEFSTFLFVRSLGASLPGAAAAGMIFALGGFMTSWQGFPVADAAIWLPLGLLGIERLRKVPSARNIAWTSIALAMPVLAGHVETAAHEIDITGA